MPETATPTYYCVAFAQNCVATAPLHQTNYSLLSFFFWWLILSNTCHVYVRQGSIGLKAKLYNTFDSECVKALLRPLWSMREEVYPDSIMFVIEIDISYLPLYKVPDRPTSLSSMNLPLSFSASTSRELLSQFSTCIGWKWLEVGGVLGWLLVVVLFAPIWGGSLGICSVCWMLCTALYGSTSLQQSSKGSCSLLVSGYNLRADCQWRTLVPPLNSGANAAPASVLALM